jgi:hypothetical protein
MDEAGVVKQTTTEQVIRRLADISSAPKGTAPNKTLFFSSPTLVTSLK